VRCQHLLQINGRAGRAEREMGGGVGSGVPRGRGRKRERGGRRGVDSRTAGPKWLRVARSEAAASARDGGGLTNRGGRRGAGDRWGRAGTGPDVSGGVQEREG
jgi:hypothetical protein